MLSLGPNARHERDAIANGIADDDTGARRVLPRFLRRPTRVFNRLLAGNVSIGRSGWLALGVSGLLIAGAGAIANTRQGHSIVADISALAGFTIEAVVVEGISELSENDVVTRLDLGPSKSLFSFDIERAREDLQKLAWVKDVVVAKTYPDRLSVRINERKPFAIWQKGNALSIIERDGIKIDRFDDRFSNLPLLVGKGANIHGAEIVFMVKKIAVLENKVKAYVRVGARRWDLRLNNGLVVRLPDENVAIALEELARLDQVHNLFMRDIEIIDMRLSDRLVLALSEAEMRRRANLSGVKTDNGKEKKI